MLNAASVAPHVAPAVSVIVPVYGQLAYTLNCLDALLSHHSKQTFEIVVVDDFSPDQKRHWLSHVRGIRLHARTSNGGFIAACNDGASQARGQWLVFLNNDTRVVAGWLDALIDSYATLADAELVGSKLFYPDSTFRKLAALFGAMALPGTTVTTTTPIGPVLLRAQSITSPALRSLLRALAVWDEIGGFDTRYTPAYGEDSDFALKVRYGRRKQVKDAAAVTCRPL